MNLAINGKHVDIGETLRSHVEESLNTAVAKYFENALEGTVTFSRESRLFRVDISVHAGRGMAMQGGATQRRRLHRLRRCPDAHRQATEALQAPPQRPPQGGAARRPCRPSNTSLPRKARTPRSDAQDQPTIVAELPTEIATLTVGEAVMRMDLADIPAMMFRNRAHGRLNVVYRRPDGNVGWIDPADAH